jgi:hypothetical protein
MSAPQSTSLDLGQTLAAAGSSATAFEAMWDALWHQPALPPALLELCRLRLAQLHRADSELARNNPAVSVAPEKINSLLHGDYARDGLFSAAELAVLDFAEVYAQDPAALSDEQAAAVKEHFGEKGLVVLVKALGFIDGRIRMARLFTQLSARAA